MPTNIGICHKRKQRAINLSEIKTLKFTSFIHKLKVRVKEEFGTQDVGRTTRTSAL